MTQPVFDISAKIGDTERTIVKRHIDSPSLIGEVLNLDLLGFNVKGVDFEQEVQLVLTISRRK